MSLTNYDKNRGGNYLSHLLPTCGNDAAQQLKGWRHQFRRWDGGGSLTTYFNYSRQVSQLALQFGALHESTP